MASTLHQDKMLDVPRPVRLERGKRRAELVQVTMDRGPIARATEWRPQASPQHSREKTASLEMLAAEMLRREETEKKKLAARLQEDLAQTLTAIRFSVEQSMENAGASEDIRRYLLWTVPALQAAIRQVQALAMELRPSGLDDFGLLPTIRLLCREFERQHPAVRIEERICVQPDYAFGPLAILIYRVVESAFASIAQFADTEWISLSLLLDDRTIVLTIEVIPCAESDAGWAQESTDPDPNSCFASVRGRTALSGGAFSAARNNSGGITLRATWAL